MPVASGAQQKGQLLWALACKRERPAARRNKVLQRGRKRNETKLLQPAMRDHAFGAAGTHRELEGTPKFEPDRGTCRRERAADRQSCKTLVGWPRASWRPKRTSRRAGSAARTSPTAATGSWSPWRQSDHGSYRSHTRLDRSPPKSSRRTANSRAAKWRWNCGLSASGMRHRCIGYGLARQPSGEHQGWGAGSTAARPAARARERTLKERSFVKLSSLQNFGAAGVPLLFLTSLLPHTF